MSLKEQTANANSHRQADPGVHWYVSYLLRMWSAEQGEATCSRASLEDPHTGERFGFASPEELFSFLTEKVEGKNRAESDSSH